MENRISYLMGAPGISDRKLKSLGVKIIGTTPVGNRKLEIPASSLEKFEKLVALKMNPGFWCDILGQDEIIFIFKSRDEEIQRFVLSDDNQAEIAKLCSEFSRDPLEKTSDILGYLAGNEFYGEFIEKYYLEGGK